MENQHISDTIAKDILEIVPLLRSNINAHIHYEIDKRRWVTPGQLRLLYLIDQGTTSARGLAARQKVSAPTISRQVDCLVEKGLVQRENMHTDRRMVALTLTTNGANVLNSVMGSTQAWIASLLTSLEPEEQKILQDAMILLKVLFKQEQEKVDRG